MKHVIILFIIAICTGCTYERQSSVSERDVRKHAEIIFTKGESLKTNLEYDKKAVLCYEVYLVFRPEIFPTCEIFPELGFYRIGRILKDRDNWLYFEIPKQKHLKSTEGDRGDAYKISRELSEKIFNQMNYYSNEDLSNNSLNSYVVNDYVLINSVLSIGNKTPTQVSFLIDIKHGTGIQAFRILGKWKNWRCPKKIVCPLVSTRSV